MRFLEVLEICAYRSLEIWPLICGEMDIGDSVYGDIICMQVDLQIIDSLIIAQ
jgi:hypothetical protein